MNLELHLKKEKAVLFIKNGERVVDCSEWPENNDLSQRLLFEIDKIIKRNKLRKQDVKKMMVKSDIPVGYTTQRIAESVAKTFNFSV